MKILKYLLIVLLVFLIAAGVIVWKAGFFTSISVKEQTMGPYTVVYEEHQGDYAMAGVIQKKIYDFLIEKEIETTKGFGIYLDDPGSVDKELLRSEIGCIVDHPGTEIYNLKDDPYKIREIVRGKYMVIEFPFKNQLSILAGIMRAYPKLEQHRIEQGYAKSYSMEIYDVPNEKIFYLMEIGL
jgi:DNA gyrase inhibitor GyrI